LRDELGPRTVDVRLVRLDGAGGRVRGGAGLFRLILRDDAPLRQLRLPFRGQLLILGVRRVATELRFGLREQRLIAGQIGFRLCERGFERAPIELKDELPLLDDVAFAKRHFDERAGDLGPHRVADESLDVADGRQVDRHIPLADFRGHDRRVAAAAPSPSSTAAASAVSWSGGRGVVTTGGTGDSRRPHQDNQRASESHR